MYPHFNSNHPKHIFSGLIRTETFRYSKLSATKDEYNYIKTLFTIRISALNYPSNYIYKFSFPWLNSQTHKIKTPRKQHNTPQINTIFYRTQFNKHIRTDIITKSILKKYHNMHIPKLRQAKTVNTKMHTLLNTNKKLHQKLTIANQCK